MTEHLGTASELCFFAMEMAKQLELHQDEKKPLRYVDFEKVRKLVIKEIRDRLELIENLPDNYESMQMTALQFTHIGNYSLIGFLRARYNV